MSKTLRAAIVVATLALVAPPLYAQQSDPEAGTYELPRGWVSTPTPGIFGEPSILAKLAMSTDSALGGGPREGWYFQAGSLITGGERFIARLHQRLDEAGRTAGAEAVASPLR